MVFIPFPEPIVKATFIRRYKRFLTDFILEDGSEITAHCANTGSMKACLEEGAPALLWDSKSTTRKTRYSFKAIKIGKTWIGIDTMLPNALVEKAIRAGEIEALSGYEDIQRERKMGDKSRVDVLLSGKSGLCYVEVKNVTLVEGGMARFPDAVTTRGLKHLQELRREVLEGGHRAAMVFVVQRADGKAFVPADDIDPEYGKTLREVHAAGVEIYVLGTRVGLDGVRSTGLIEYKL